MEKSGPLHIVVMGVAACGKSTVGAALGEKLAIPFIDGDSLHPVSSIDKMSSGVPLNDTDRLPWLQRVSAELAAHPDLVIACSALKRVYRDVIREQAGVRVLFVHLVGSRTVLSDRMARRSGHFMPLSLLDDQLATLEPPEPDELALTVSIEGDSDMVIARACRALADYLERAGS